MKINNIYNKLTIAVLTAASLFTVSCQEDDNLARQGKPVLSLESNVITVGEGGSAYFRANLSYPINDYVAIRMELLDDEGNTVLVTEPDGGAGTGNGYSPIAHEDLDIAVDSAPYPAVGIWETWFEAGAFDYGYLGGTGYVFTADRNVTSFEFPVGTLVDNIVEGTETYRFKLSATSKMNAIVNEIITVHIEDATPTTLDVLLDFDGNMNIDGNTFDKCGLDFDLYIADDPSSPYANNAWYNYSDCNELLSGGNAGGPIDNDPNNWADGTVYQIFVDFWAKNNASVPSYPSLPTSITQHENIPMDIVFTKVKDGVTTTHTLVLTDLFATDDLASEDGATQEEGVRKIGTIEINGNDYRITNELTGEVTLF